MDLLLGDLGNSQAEGDVVIDIQVRKKRIALENRIDLSFIGGHIIDPLTVEKHIAVGGRQKAADDAQGGGLAAAGGAEQGQKFVIVDIEVDAVQDALTVKFHGEVLEANQFFGHVSSPVSVCTEKSRRSSGDNSMPGKHPL